VKDVDRAGARRGVGPLRIGKCVLAVALLVASFSGCFFARVSARNALIVFRSPDEVPDRIVDPRRPDARLAVLWIGHSTVLFQLDDKFVLTDPVFTNFVGTVSHRLVEPGLRPENVPFLTAVLISHRHYDHLSPDSIEDIQNHIANVLVPEATAADVPPGPYLRFELSWWQSWESEGLRVTAVPVMHEGGRALDAGSHPRSFTGYVLEYHGLVVYFPGDTAYDGAGFHAVAARYPRIDLALLPICPTAPRDEMHATHMDAAEAVQAAHDLGAKRMIPIHFDTFINSDEDRGDCLRALEQAARLDTASGLEVLPLRIGEQRVLEPRVEGG
jgi:L-ascorbate metabolism protein UlaG (beta-lactamase superfamily)